ncbi:hypothetical protein [Burkholderia sp. WSM2232]|uniref:hypothetical protein n=1 Tax=Burkholderia sp. WSM2232 TaxID=944436 RepID=UPI0012EBCFD4|nr:hypothetical protein [Burkholderia sp. WSM2232]
MLWAKKRLRLRRVTAAHRRHTYRCGDSSRDGSHRHANHAAENLPQPDTEAIMRCVVVLFVMLINAVSAVADDWQDRLRSDRHVPKVFDARGKFVGPLEGSSSGDGVYLDVNGAVVFAAITRQTNGAQASATQWQWASSAFIPYASTDCSGPPLIAYYYAVQPAIAVRQGADVELYVSSGGYSTIVHASSARQNPTLSQCSPYSYDIPAFIVNPNAYSLTQHYPEPLTIRY